MMKRAMPFAVAALFASLLSLSLHITEVKSAAQTFWHNVKPVIFNPTLNRHMEWEGNYDGLSLLTLTAQGTGTVNGTDQENVNHRGVQVVVNITTLTGTGPTVTVTIQGRDPTSGVYYTLLASAALAATGTTVLTVYPGVTAAANTAASQVVPRTWRVIATVAGTTPAATATVAAALIL